MSSFTHGYRKRRQGGLFRQGKQRGAVFFDSEYDQAIEDFDDIRAHFSAFEEEIKAYLAAMEAMGSAASALVGHTYEFFGDSARGSSGYTMSMRLTHASAATNAVMADLARTRLKDNVLVPTQAVNAKFPPIVEKIDVRAKKLAEYEYYRKKVQQLTLDPGNDMERYLRNQEKLEQARNQYEAAKQQVVDDVDELFLRRHQLFEAQTTELGSVLEQFYRAGAAAWSERRHSGPSPPRGRSPTLYPNIDVTHADGNGHAGSAPGSVSSASGAGLAPAPAGGSKYRRRPSVGRPRLRAGSKNLDPADVGPAGPPGPESGT